MSKKTFRTACGLVVGFLVLQVVTPMNVIAASNDAWQASEGDEDWGHTCFMSRTTKGGDEVGFYGTTGFELAFLNLKKVDYSKIPDGMKSYWQVDENQPFALDGGKNDYFSWLEYEVAKYPALLQQLTSGHQLKIQLPGFAQFSVDLIGSKKALTEFLTCSRAK